MGSQWCFYVVAAAAYHFVSYLPFLLYHHLFYRLFLFFIQRRLLVPHGAEIDSIEVYTPNSSIVHGAVIDTFALQVARNRPLGGTRCIRHRLPLGTPMARVVRKEDGETVCPRFGFL